MTPLSSSQGRFRLRRVRHDLSLWVAAGLISLVSMGFSPDATAAAPTSTSNPLPGYLIIPLGRGHNNRLCLAATIAGKKGLMIVDTGASSTALNAATYGALLQNVKTPQGATPLKTVRINGMSTPLTTVPDFNIGKVNLGTFSTPLLPRRLLYEESPLDRSGSGRIYDGLLGENILRHYNAVLDCGRLVLYLNTDPARKMKLTGAFQSNGWTRVPMSDVGNNFTVPCKLNGHDFRLLVDTGAPFTSLDRNLLAGAGINARDLPLSGGLIGRRAQQEGLVNLTRLDIGAYTALNLHMTASPQSFAEFGGPHDLSTQGPILGLLGGDALAGNAAVVDVGNKALYLKHTDSGTVRKKP